MLFGKEGGPIKLISWPFVADCMILYCGNNFFYGSVYIVSLLCINLHTYIRTYIGFCELLGVQEGQQRASAVHSEAVGRRPPHFQQEPLRRRPRHRGGPRARVCGKGTRVLYVLCLYCQSIGVGISIVRLWLTK